ncbi:MAG: hypothetical protein U0V75_11000 [Ferruginibacter sp.]
MKKILLLLFISTGLAAAAQNISSPYSVLGIGDIENDDYGRYSASGGASVSRRENGYYNFSNPASLTVMNYKSINLDFGFRGRSARFLVPGTDTFTATTKDFIVKRITMAFKLTPSTAIAFGLKPFSSVNYQYSAIHSISDGDAQYLKATDGSGGLYQSYFSAAKQLNKHLSVGATASWLFGALQNSTEYYNSNIGLDIIKNENKFYNGAGLQAGLQYYSSPLKKWQHTLGLTGTAYTRLKGQNTVDYTENSTTIKTLDPEDISFKLPLAFSTGYSIKNNSGISLHLQGSYQKWPAQRLSYSSSFVRDAYGLNAGMEYSKMLKEAPVENYYIGWGVKMEQSYLMVNNQRLNTYAATVGGGKNISRLIAVNGGLEFGKRGDHKFSQIQENYFQFSVGITFKDFWFGTKRFGRFN